MDRKTQLHIEYLREMLSTRWADDARKELKEIMEALGEKGVVVV